MKITEVRYERIKNTGNYENEKLSVVVAINENDDPNEAVRRARKFVERHLFGPEPDALEQAKSIIKLYEEVEF